MAKKDLHNQKLVEEANHAHLHFHTRRHFLKESAMGLGALALGSLVGCRSRSYDTSSILFDPAHPLAPKLPPFPGKAKAVIYLHMAGAPSQLELFDYKPELMKLDGQDCPQSLLEGKRFAFIRGVPKMLGPQAKFAQHGESRAWVSEHLPHFSTIVDEVSFLKAVTTDQFNHAPAQLLVHTGSATAGQTKSWVMGYLWFGNRESKFAGLCCAYIRAENFLMPAKVFGAVDFCHVYTRVCNAEVKATRFYL